MNNTYGRILWKCRRGSLELDLILSRFCEREWSSLSPQEQQKFEQFLDEDDTLLASWIFGDKLPSNPEYARWITQIKKRIR